jgi:small-conductance mechanosensitive channel
VGGIALALAAQPTIENFIGSIVHVPNADFSKRELTNYSRRRRRLYETTVAVSRIRSG